MRRSRAGFTLIELLIVVVIIGILAAITIPKFKNTKAKAAASSLKTDLRNLTTAQEAFFYSYNRYSTNVDSLGFRTTRGVVLTIAQGDQLGWAASVTHPDAYPLKCAIFIANAAPVTPATTEGLMACQ